MNIHTHADGDGGQRWRDGDGEGEWGDTLQGETGGDCTEQEGGGTDGCRKGGDQQIEAEHEVHLKVERRRRRCRRTRRRGTLEEMTAAKPVEESGGEEDDGGGAGREQRSLAELTSLSVADARINLGELTSGRLPFFRVMMSNVETPPAEVGGDQYRTFQDGSTTADGLFPTRKFKAATSWLRKLVC